MDILIDKVKNINLIKNHTKCLLCNKLTSNLKFCEICNSNYMDFMDTQKCITCGIVFIVNNIDDRECVTCGKMY